MVRNSYKLLAFGTVIGTLLVVLGASLFGSGQPVPTMSAVVKTSTPIYSVKTPEKVCSITFDCAWAADDIERILQTLKKMNVKATFFVVGTWAQKNPEAIRLIEKDGHDISSHGFTHLKFPQLERGRAKLELENFLKEIKVIIKKDTWQGMNLFRAPYGDWNKNVVALAGEEGFHTIQWSVDTLDYKPNVTKDFIMGRVNTGVADGGIILMHTGTKLTAEILEEIINKIWDKGFGIIPVSKLIYQQNYTVDANGVQIKN